MHESMTIYRYQEALKYQKYYPGKNEKKEKGRFQKRK